MKIHIVRQGESFHELVQKYNVPFERLLEANPHLDENSELHPGSKIRIPTGKVPVPAQKLVEEGALVEDLAPIFLDPVSEDSDFSWEFDPDWDEDQVDQQEEKSTSKPEPFAPMYPTEAAFQPYFSTSGFVPYPTLPYPIYSPPAYPSSFYRHKKESSSTVYS